jgi:hypothetical protein
MIRLIPTLLQKMSDESSIFLPGGTSYRGRGDSHKNGSNHHAPYSITFTRTGPINPPDISPDRSSVGPGRKARGSRRVMAL